MTTSRSRAYALVGAVLGLGAPLGLLALRTVLARKSLRSCWRHELRRERVAYSYMALSTPIVFGMFGNALGRRQDKLREAHEEIERMREEFCAVVAHDLRNPISAISLQLDILRSGATDGSVNVRLDTLDRLGRSCERLSHMVTDLLDATRIEAAQLRVALEPTSVPAAVTALVDRIRPTVGKHPLELAVEGSPPAILADPTRLDQIVTNLIDNAAKYSPDGAPIRVEIAGDHGGVMLRVRDQGHGIAAADLPHLFERYFQTERAREKKSGLGLGLYITKGLVDAHRGTITVESEPDRGSTFSIWFPATAGVTKPAPTT